MEGNKPTYTHTNTHTHTHTHTHRGIMETDWEFSKVLHTMWKIFDESTAKERCLYQGNWLYYFSFEFLQGQVG